MKREIVLFLKHVDNGIGLRIRFGEFGAVGCSIFRISLFTRSNQEPYGGI
jgi:hypothetical protein